MCDPIAPHDGIMPLVILPIVQLVYRHSLGLLLAMVCRIQNKLRTLKEQFCRKVTTTKVGKELIFPRNRPSLRVEMPYTYLLAWFTLHYPVLIQLGEEAPEGECYTHLCHFENSQWEDKYYAGVWRPVER